MELEEIPIHHRVQTQWQQRVVQQLLQQPLVMHALSAVIRHRENIMACIGKSME